MTCAQEKILLKVLDTLPAVIEAVRAQHVTELAEALGFSINYEIKEYTVLDEKSLSLILTLSTKEHSYTLDCMFYAPDSFIKTLLNADYISLHTKTTNKGKGGTPKIEVKPYVQALFKSLNAQLKLYSSIYYIPIPHLQGIYV